MIWKMRVAAAHQDYTDLSGFNVNPLQPRIGPALYYSVRGRFRLSQPFARYGFQTDGYVGWGTQGKPFHDDIEKYLTVFNLSIDDEALRSKIFILDPLKFFSYGWYLEEPFDKGTVGAHNIYTSFLWDEKRRRGIDTCFNHYNPDQEDFYPPPASAFFEEENSFSYVDPSHPTLPRIACPQLVRSDWWERLRFFIRIFDTIYILKPTEYSRQCFYRLIEDELPAILNLFFSKENYEKRPLTDALSESFGGFSPTKAQIFSIFLYGRVGIDYVAPSFAQSQEISDPFAPYPIASLLVPTPPFVSQIPSLLAKAHNKKMTYSPYTPGPCMFPGPQYEGHYEEIDSYGFVPVITAMTESEFEEWKTRTPGGFTLFSIGSENQPFISTGLPLLLWHGTCGDYIIFFDEIVKESQVLFQKDSTEELRSGWHTTAGGVRFFSRYFVSVGVTGIFQYLDFRNAYAYTPPTKETIQEKVYPYFTVERMHTLLLTRKRHLLLKPSGFIHANIVVPNFNGLLNTINEDAPEFVSLDFGTTYPEMSSSFPGPQWLCSNVNVWHLGGASLPVEWYSDKISAFSVSEKTSGNREFFLKLLIPLLSKTFKIFADANIDWEWIKTIRKYAPKHVVLTGWKGYNATNRKPADIPWTMLSSGHILTLEDKVKYVGNFLIAEEIPDADQLSSYESVLDYLRYLWEKVSTNPPPFGEERKDNPLVGDFLQLYLKTRRSQPSFLEAVKTLLARFDVGITPYYGAELMRKIKEISPFIEMGFSSWAPITQPMIERDPAVGIDRPNASHLPNKILFTSCCVDPPEVQSIAGWYVWSNVWEKRIDPTWSWDEIKQTLEELWFYDDNIPFPNDEKRQKRKEYIRRLSFIVNGLKWNLSTIDGRLPDDWDEFAKIMHFFDFSHKPFIFSFRALFEWDINNLGKRFVKLAPYTQPLLIADIKEPPLPDTWAFGEKNVVTSDGENVKIGKPDRADTTVDAAHTIKDNVLPRIAAAEQLINECEGKIEKLPTLPHLSPFGSLTSLLSTPTEMGDHTHILYAGDVLSHIGSWLETKNYCPFFDEIGFTKGLPNFPDAFVEFTTTPITAVSPHKVLNKWGWVPATKENYLVNVTSLLTTTPIVYQPALLIVDGENILVKKIGSSASVFPSFYYVAGKKQFGHSSDRWEKKKYMATGDGKIGGVVFPYENLSIGRSDTLVPYVGITPLIEGITEATYHASSASYQLNLFYAKTIKNFSNIFHSHYGVHENEKTSRLLYSEGNIWGWKWVPLHPYLRWLGGMVPIYPALNFRVKGATKDYLVSADWLSVPLPNPTDPFNFKPLVSFIRFPLGNHRGTRLDIVLGIPPLPTDFVPERSPHGERDFGLMWEQVRERLKKIFGDERYAYSIPTSQFTLIPPPWGWIGCIDAPNVNPRNLRRINPTSFLLSMSYAYGNNDLPLSWITQTERSPYSATYILTYPADDSFTSENPPLWNEEKWKDKGTITFSDNSTFVYIVLSSGNKFRKRYYLDYSAYIEKGRTSYKPAGANTFILSPDEVTLDARREKVNGEQVIAHSVNRFRYRIYLLPLVPVNFAGIPVCWRANEKTVEVDLMPSEYGSVTFALLTSTSFAFGEIKEKVKKTLKETTSEPEKSVIVSLLKDWLRKHLWLNEDDLKEKDLEELVDMIPSHLLIGSPWYSPFAAYYVPTHAVTPASTFKHKEFGVPFVFSLVNGKATTVKEFRKRLINLMPTVYPEWMPANYTAGVHMRPLILDEGRENERDYNVMVLSEVYRLPAAIVAMQSPFINGGATFIERLQSLWLWSHFHLPDPNMGGTSPLHLFSPAEWTRMLFSKVPSTPTYYLRDFHRRLHVSRLVSRRWEPHLGLTSNTFSSPFVISPFHRYPFNIWAFTASVSLWRPASPVRWSLSYSATSSFVASYEETNLQEMRLSDQSLPTIPTYKIETNLPPKLGWLEHEKNIAFPDYAIPRQTIGTRFWGGYGDLRYILLPPTPVIVHSSFNFGYAEFRINPQDPRTFVAWDEEPEKIFQVMETSPFIIIRNYVRGFHFRWLSPSAPEATEVDNPFSLEVFSLVNTDDFILGQYWGSTYPDRFHWHALSSHKDKWYSDNYPLFNQTKRPPTNIAANRLLNRPEYLIGALRLTCPSHQRYRPFLSLEIQEITHTSDGNLCLILVDNSYPRWVVLPVFVPADTGRGTGKGFSDKVTPHLPNIYYLYYPILGGKLSPVHRFIINEIEMKFLFLAGSTTSFIHRMTSRDFKEDRLKLAQRVPPVGFAAAKFRSQIPASNPSWWGYDIDVTISQHEFGKEKDTIVERIKTYGTDLLGWLDEITNWRNGIFISRQLFQWSQSGELENYELISETFLPLIVKRWLDDTASWSKIKTEIPEGGDRING